MPGYGASEQRADQDVSLAAPGRLFAELLEHWGLDEPAVVARAELALLDDAGHLIQEDAPEPLLARLTAFLQAHA